MLAGFVKTRDDYKCFNVDDPGGLVVILQDLMSYEDDELRICSASLLYAIYKVMLQVIIVYMCNNHIDVISSIVERTSTI